MKVYGLIGEKLNYSFSKDYFSKKFERLELNCSYENFELAEISEFHNIFQSGHDIHGLNVTIPYKKSVIPYLDDLDDVAKEIGAVNTIVLNGSKGLIGSNTDAYGFMRSLAAMLKPHHERALILGSGGASEAVKYVLSQMGVDYRIVSRTPNENQFGYSDLNKYVLKHFTLIINTTPVGTYPKVDESPEIPYHFMSAEHLLYDLVYNPEVSQFLKKGSDKGAQTINGYRMLTLQAERSWELWNR